jgi:hypothetical protein
MFNKFLEKIVFFVKNMEWKTRVSGLCSVSTDLNCTKKKTHASVSENYILLRT